jgi:hypothetical protein
MPKINTSTFPSDPIGILLNGKLSVVRAEDPPFRPQVIDDVGNVVEPDSDEVESEQRATVTQSVV